MEVVGIADEEGEGDESEEEIELDKNVTENILVVAIGIEEEGTAHQQGEVKGEEIEQHGTTKGEFGIQRLQFLFFFLLVYQNPDH